MFERVGQSFPDEVVARKADRRRQALDAVHVQVDA
jgi:hypothetical protein